MAALSALAIANNRSWPVTNNSTQVATISFSSLQSAWELRNTHGTIQLYTLCFKNVHPFGFHISN